MNLFKTKPLATLISVMVVVFGVDTSLIGAGVLHGSAAAWATALAGALSTVLGVVAHRNVTPLTRPRDNAGYRLVRERTL